jgi:iron complex transport system substrate-binding protein
LGSRSLNSTGRSKALRNPQPGRSSWLSASSRAKPKSLVPSIPFPRLPFRTPARLARLASILLASLSAITAATSVSASQLVVDSAGRHVEIPDHIQRVQAAGPPASVLLTMLAPEKLIGWVRKPRGAELTYLPPVVRNLPEVGRLTGRGDTANLEAVIAEKPDVIIDFGSITPTYVSLADRVQSQTGIPYLLIDGHFNNTAVALRLAGRLLGVDGRAETLARRTEEILSEIDRVAASVPAERHPRVYLARQPTGLESGNRGSINTEIIERAGGINVVEGGREGGGLVTVSMEQVLAWNPDTIVTTDAKFFNTAATAIPWSQTDAVRKHRVFLSPTLPYGWVDAPPSLNRLIGLQWLARLFFPDRFPENIRTVAQDFYKQFYQVDVNEADLDRLLANAEN